MTAQAATLQTFFTHRMARQRQVSRMRSPPTGTRFGYCWSLPRIRRAKNHPSWTSMISMPS